MFNFFGRNAFFSLVVVFLNIIVTSVIVKNDYQKGFFNVSKIELMIIVDEDKNLYPKKMLHLGTHLPIF
jgi:hypothetical protein